MNILRKAEFKPQNSSTKISGYFQRWGDGVCMRQGQTYNITVGIVESLKGEVYIAEPSDIKFTETMDEYTGRCDAFNKSQVIPVIRPPHEIIRNHMAADSLTSLDMSRKMGMGLGDIEQLLSGDIEIRVLIADKLASVFPDTDKSYWLTKEKEYQDFKKKQ